MLALGASYRRLWWANAINSVGDGAFLAALPLLAVTITHDPRQISLIAVASYLPWLVLSLPAGVLVDRYDRAGLMWRCQAFQAGVVAAIAVAAGTHRVGIPALLLASFLLGCAQVVITNAAQSVLPQLVPIPLLQKANSTQYMAQTLGQLSIGPPVGSVLFAVTAALPFGLDAASFVLSAALLARLPRNRPAARRRSSVGSEMGEGLRWLGSHRLLRTLAVMLGMNTFCFQLGFATLVLYATQTLRLSDRAYGLMLVGMGLGSLLGGLLNSRVAGRLGVLPALVISYALNAILFLGMGLAPNGAVLAVLLAASGAIVTITSVVTVSLRQQLVPDRLLGRVNSVYRMVGWGLMPLGSLLGGLVAHRYGLRAPFLTAGVLRLLVLAGTLPSLLTGLRQLAPERV
ncbi:MAG TPA: MFS transporter [Jatrophihabitans sp.]|nr:MFS transporter [Jatrophihabitans sp.]